MIGRIDALEHPFRGYHQPCWCCKVGKSRPRRSLREQYDIKWTCFRGSPPKGSLQPCKLGGGEAAIGAVGVPRPPSKVARLSPRRSSPRGPEPATLVRSTAGAPWPRFCARARPPELPSPSLQLLPGRRRTSALTGRDLTKAEAAGGASTVGPGPPAFGPDCVP